MIFGQCFFLWNKARSTTGSGKDSPSYQKNTREPQICYNADIILGDYCTVPLARCPSVIVNVWKVLGGVNFHCELGLVEGMETLGQKMVQQSMIFSFEGLTSIHPLKNRICSAYARATLLVLGLCMASL